MTKRYIMKKESRTKAPKIISFTFYAFALLILIIAAYLIIGAISGKSLTVSNDIIGATICIVFAVLALVGGMKNRYR